MPELTREQIEGWREWFSLMFNGEVAAKQRDEANTLCDMAASACPPPEGALASLLEDLQTVANGAGPFSRDPLKHAENCIELAKDTAKRAIAELEHLSAARAPATFKCKARNSSAPDPQDCGWPVCGCDPYADKVIAALDDQVRTALKSADAGTEANPVK